MLVENKGQVHFCACYIPMVCEKYLIYDLQKYTN